MSTKRDLGFVLRPPPLDGATAAWIFDLCGQLQRALMQAHGEQMEAHWTGTEPDQPLYGRLQRRPLTSRPSSICAT